MLDANDNEVASKKTSSNTPYYFSGLNPGSYKVIVEMPNSVDNILSLQSVGVADKTSAQDNANYAIFSDDASTQHKRFVWSFKMDENDTTFNLNAGEDFKAVDFGFVNFGIISGRAFDDRNNNGIQDSGEPGIEGLTVTLFKNDVSISTSTTDSDGRYAFGKIKENGDYKVVFSKPNNYKLIAPDQGADDIDSDAVETNGKIAINNITLSANDKDKKHNDVGFFSGYQLKGKVFEDKNKDGIFVDESLYNNALTVSLTLADGSPAKDIFGNDNTKDSDFLVDTGLTEAFDLSSIPDDGYIKEDIDLGIFTKNSGGDVASTAETTMTEASKESEEESTSALESGEASETTTSAEEESSSESDGSIQSTRSNSQVEIAVTTSEKASEVEVITPPDGGEIEIDEDGKVRFIPNAGFSGKTRAILKITYEDGSEEFIEFDITDNMIAESKGSLPKTGGVPMTTYILIGLLPLSAGLVLKRK